jgi:5'-3' exonuclease
MVNFLLVDASYFCFYRLYAIYQWFKLAKPGEIIENPVNNKTFMDKFEKTFIQKFQEIPLKLNIENPIIIVGKDCHRKDIWRNSLFENYKSNRDYTNFKGGPVFKKVWENNLFKKAGAKLILHHPKLEADDCIAIMSKHVINMYDDAKVWIITSDMDYLQLASDKVEIFNLKFKDLTLSKNAFKDSDKDLFCKIVSGDKSDGIPSVFKKCGIKTAEKYWNNKQLFQEKLAENEEARKQYELNKRLVDFREIPKDLIEEFLALYGINGGY